MMMKIATAIYDDFMPAGGGVMMWDDDEQYVPQNEPVVAL